jgi:hypothetical protein
MINGVLFLLFVYLVAMPFYVFPSGLPQPSDFVLSGAFALFGLYCIARASLHLREDLRQPGLIVFIFALYVVCVGLWWTGALGEIRVSIFPLFYIFNFIAFLLVLSLYSLAPDRTLKLVGIAVLASIVLQAFLSSFLQKINEEGVRQVAFFNNPNQLGYYALLAASVIALAHHRRALPRSAYLIGMLCAVWLSALSLSKAALVAMAVLVIVEAARGRIAVPVVLGTLLAGIAATGIVDLIVLENVITRLEDIGASGDDSAAGRGYNRIWLYPEYLVFGAGEGAFYRFSGTNNGEIHSTFGTILFSYGIVGSGLFLIAALLILLQVRFVFAFYLVPAAMYGLTHNGLRDTLVWILLALVLTGRQATHESILPERAGEPSAT